MFTGQGYITTTPLELVRGCALLGLRAGHGERLVERGIGHRDEIADATADGAQHSQGSRPARGRLEGIARPAALAERLSENLGHRLPGSTWLDSRRAHLRL